MTSAGFVSRAKVARFAKLQPFVPDLKDNGLIGINTRESINATRKNSPLTLGVETPS